MARKLTGISKEQILKLIDAGLSEKQIAGVFDCSTRLIRKKFPGIFKRGPKKIQITPEILRQIESLASIMCTDEEISSVLGISRDTYIEYKKAHSEISDSTEKGKAKGRMSVRRKQHQVAMNGNATMLIWLGKQYLGQDDKQQVDVTAHHGIAYLPQPETPKEFAEKSKAFLDYLKQTMEE